MDWRTLAHFFHEIYNGYFDDRVAGLSAALAYYTIFSLAPLLIILIAIAGLVFGDEAAEGLIIGQIQSLVGEEKTAGLIQDMIAGASKKSSSIAATVISVGILLFGASRVFVHLHDALNIIWHLKPSGAIHAIRSRFLSFLMVISAGFLILLSLVLTGTLSAVFNYMAANVPGLQGLWRGLDLAVGYGITMLIFALVFKFVPDARIAWNDVWLGALVTMLLYTLGRLLLLYYLRWGVLGSVYGAASSLVVLLFWVYYSTQILFLGAEITWAYARIYGSHKRPDEP